jgi:hypothetical protein
LSYTDSCVSSVEEIFISEYSWCSSDNLEEPLTLSGSTSCDTFATIRECEAQYLIERCGAAEEHQYIRCDLNQYGYYVKCREGDTINCFPISHWRCPDCPNCNPGDPNFIGCLSDTQENRDRLGNQNCPFNGSLDGSTSCSAIFDDLRECLRLDCESKCGPCTETYTGFYTLCDDNGTPSCRPMGVWSCNGCEIDPKTGCDSTSGGFNPSAIDIPLSVQGGGGNPSAITVRIPLAPSDNLAAGNRLSGINIRIPSGINELAPPGAPYQIVNINGSPPYTTGFDIKNIKVELDNLTGELKTSFDASLFYCEAGYQQNNNIYLCPPENFSNENPSNCVDCGNLDIIKA